MKRRKFLQLIGVVSGAVVADKVISNPTPTPTPIPTQLVLEEEENKPLPAYSFNGEGDIGLYYASENKISFCVNGVEKFDTKL